MLKNVGSQKIGAQMVSATDGSAFTGSVTVAVTLDAGTQATGSVGSGACTHEGNGYHTYAPAQAETNGDLAAFTFTGTGSVPATIQVYTLPATGILAPTVLGRTLVVDGSGLADANTVKVGPTGSGTAQTARDIGASVLLSSGTGTGQLKLASGYVAMTWADIAAPTTSVALTGTTIAVTQKVDVETIKTQTVTCAAGVTVNVNVGSTQPLNFTGTAGSALVKTDMVDIAGAAVSASTAQLGVNVVNFGGSAGTFASGIPSVNSTQFGGSAVVHTTGKVWALDGSGNAIASATNLATAQTSIDDIPTNAELTTALGTADDAVLVQVALVKAKTDNLPASPAAVGSAMTLTSAYDFAKGTVAMTESYSSDGSAPTPVQSLLLTQQALTEFVISGTTMTIKKVDGTTTAATATLNDGSSPTGITRAT